MIRTLSLFALLTMVTMAGGAQQTPPPPPGAQLPPRDATGRQPADQPAGTGRITGRVTAAPEGRPIKRARVFATARELPGGRGVLTDDTGVFDITDLPAGQYTISASKPGFLTLSYGQRRPQQAGVPVQLADRQQAKGIDILLPRGGVIEGRVEDEDGYPISGVVVRAMRYEYVQGMRRLIVSNSAQTDDEGHYRLWGLMPGDYVVNAVARLNFGALGGRGTGALSILGLVTTVVGQIAGQNIVGLVSDGSEQDPVYLAPTFYPGVPARSEATAIKVGLGEQAHDISFRLQLVRTSRVTGRAVSAGGTPIPGGTIQLTSATDPFATPYQLGDNFGGSIQGDGTFAINNVLPGAYVLRAQSDPSGAALFAAQPIAITGQDVANVVVELAPGATLSGTVTFQGEGQRTGAGQVLITVPPTDYITLPPVARPDTTGHFTVANLPAGPRMIRANANADRWVLKSITIADRDVTDSPIELRPRDTVPDVAIVFTDQVAEINGTVTSPDGTAATDYTVLVFTTDRSLWRPQARRIMTARPDRTGKYRIRGVPPGEYFVVLVDPTEQGEWFDPRYLDTQRTGASRVRVDEGDSKTQDLKVSAR
jgi:hypothetical protein